MKTQKNEDKKGFYDITNAMKMQKEYDAKYIYIFGQRNNGKSFQVKKLIFNGIPELGIQGFLQSGRKFVYVRRYAESFQKGRAVRMLSDMKPLIKKWSKGQYTNLECKSNTYYLTNDETGVRAECGFAVGLNNWEQDKGFQDDIGIKYIVYEEYTTRGFYLPEEVPAFFNLVSTFKRMHNDVVIILIGNTVSRYCPYYDEFGIDFKKMKKGTTNLITYGDSKLHVIFDYTDKFEGEGSEENDIYFAFNNPHMKMITDGDIETGIYPRLKEEYKQEDISLKVYVQAEEKLELLLIANNEKVYLFVHRWNKNIPEGSYYYDLKGDINNRNLINIYNNDKCSTILRRLLTEGRALYQSNYIGDQLRVFMQRCYSSCKLIK